MPMIMPARNTVPATIHNIGLRPRTVSPLSEVRMPMAVMVIAGRLAPIGLYRWR